MTLERALEWQQGMLEAYAQLKADFDEFGERQINEHDDALGNLGSVISNFENYIPCESGIIEWVESFGTDHDECYPEDEVAMTTWQMAHDWPTMASVYGLVKKAELARFLELVATVDLVEAARVIRAVAADIRGQLDGDWLGLDAYSNLLDAHQVASRLISEVSS